MSTVIYGIYSTDDGRIMYVGQTRQKLRVRMSGHEKAFCESKSLVREIPLFEWMHAKYSEGYECIPIKLDECDDAVSDLTEALYIACIPDLLNKQHKKIIGYFSSKKDVMSEKAQLAQRIAIRNCSRFEENYQGFHGVCFRHEENRFSCIIYMHYEANVLSPIGDLIRIKRRWLWPAAMDSDGETLDFETIDECLLARTQTRQRLESVTEKPGFEWPRDMQKECRSG